MDMTLLDHIKNDHDAFRVIMQRIARMNGDADEARAAQWRRLLRELMAHQRAEEELLYPHLLEDDRAHDEVVGACEAHRMMAMLLHEIGTHPVDDEAWGRVFAAFCEAVTHHLAQEELVCFANARRILGDEALDELADHWGRAKSDHMPVTRERHGLQ
jgi:hemerythrin superfamily protein